MLRLWARVVLTLAVVLGLGLGFVPAAVAVDLDPGVAPDVFSYEPPPEVEPESEPDPSVEDVVEDGAAVDRSTRDENFLTGEIGDGEFDPSEYNLWYVEREVVVADLPFADPILMPNGGDVLWGQMSDFFFTGFKNLVHVTVAFVGYLAFGLVFVAWLLEPALELGVSFQENLVGPAQLSLLVLALVGIYCAWCYARGRHAKAFFEWVASGLVLGTALMLVPGDAARYLLNLVSGASATVLVAGSGGNPASIPAPSTGEVDTGPALAAYGTFTAGLQQRLIGDVAELLTFGSMLPDACAGAYREGQALRLTTNDPRNFDAMMAIPECQTFVSQAVQPDAGRAFYAFLLLLFALAFVVVFFLLAWPALKGQVQLMMAVAAHPFLILGAALPGSMRAATLRALFKVALGVIALVLLALVLTLMLLAMGAILAGTQTLPMVVRLVGVLLVPFACWAMLRKFGKASDRKVEAVVRRAGYSGDRGQGFVERSEQRVGQVAKKHAVTAITAVAAGASGGTSAAAKVAGTAVLKGAKNVTVGSETRAGLFAGPPAKSESSSGSGQSKPAPAPAASPVPVPVPVGENRPWTEGSTEPWMAPGPTPASAAPAVAPPSSSGNAGRQAPAPTAPATAVPVATAPVVPEVPASGSSGWTPMGSAPVSPTSGGADPAADKASGFVDRIRAGIIPKATVATVTAAKNATQDAMRADDAENARLAEGRSAALASFRPSGSVPSTRSGE